jgi:16S rRNA G966 N2-methylase RsmD
MDKTQILKLFPYLKNTIKATQLKIDDESIYFISVRDVADIITTIVKKHINVIGINKNDVIVTDATSGVGGNTISFSKAFKHVNAIEIDKNRYNYLKNNLNVYDIKNVDSYNNNCMNLIYSITNHHVIFIDPPWGGRSYKKMKNIKCKISDVPIEEICNNLMKREYPKLIIIKLPKNYDLEYLNNNINCDNIYIHHLKKMLIIAIYNI